MCFFSGTSQLWIEKAGVLKNKANVLTDDWKLMPDTTIESIGEFVKIK